METVENLPTKPIMEGKKWFYLKRGPNNGGGHGYFDPAAGPITAVDFDHYMPKDGKLTLRFKPEKDGNNYGIFYTIADNDNWLYVGYDSSSHWYYQYKYNGTGAYSGLGGLPEPVAGVPMEISISVANETLMVTIDGVTVNKPVDAFKSLMEAKDGKGRFGIMTKSNPVLFTDVKLNGLDCMEDNWGFLVDRDGQVLTTVATSLADVSGTVTDKETGLPLEGATVRIGTLIAQTDAQGNYLIEKVEEGSHKTSASMKDYISESSEMTVKHGDAEVTGVDFALLSKNAIDLTKYKLIESKEMKAYVSREFPRVLRYLDAEGELIFIGQESEVNQVKINGQLFTPEVTVHTDLTAENLSAVDYTLAIHGENSIQLEMDVRISMDGMNLTWEVTDLRKLEGCAQIAAIEVPGFNCNCTSVSYGNWYLCKCPGGIPRSSLFQ